MPPDDTSGPDRQATGKPRVVWRADGTPCIAIDEDGVTKIQKLTLVPHALWVTDHWDAPSPEWATGTERPDEHFLAQVIFLDGLRRDAIDALKAALADLRVVRKRLAEIGVKDVVEPVDEIGKRIRNTVKDLDR